jgi:4-alpha-glucanotransferase
MVDQPNVPGTINEHANWRRRAPVAIDQILSAIDLSALRAATVERRRV